MKTNAVASILRFPVRATENPYRPILLRLKGDSEGKREELNSQSNEEITQVIPLAKHLPNRVMVSLLALSLVLGGDVWAANRWVSLGGNDLTGDGSTNRPFATLQKGVDASSHGDMVIVAPGTYTGSGNRAINLRGKAITVTSQEGPEATILDLGRCQGFLAHSTETLNTIIDGFTLINGYVESREDWRGDGIISILGNASLTIRNCVFRGNETKATYVTTTTGIIVKRDPAELTPVVDNCLFYSNKIGGGGWTQYGGGQALLVGGCGAGGAGLVANVKRCTIVSNTLYSSTQDWGPYGGGIRVALTGNDSKENLVWGNTDTHFPNGWQGYPSSGAQVWVAGYASYTLSYKGVSGNQMTNTILTNAPVFLSPQSGNFRLASGSPGADAGDPLSPKDPDGTRADIGYRSDRFVRPLSSATNFVMFGLDGVGKRLVKVDLAQGTLTKIADLSFASGWSGFDYNPADGFLYAAVAEGGRNQAFYRIHPQTGSVQRVGVVNSQGGDGSFESIGFRKDGSLLAYDEHYDMYTGHLLSVDLAKGTSQVLGSSRTPSCLGGDYDTIRNTFWVSDEWMGKLYQLNPTNGSILWTSQSTWYTGNGPGDMFDVDVAEDGKVYVAVTDRGAHKILRCDPSSGIWTEQCTVATALRLASVPGNVGGRPPVFTGPVVFSGKVGVSFAANVTADGSAPILFSPSVLPAGLNMSANGVISGVPNAAGSFNTTLTASNLAGQTRQMFTFRLEKGVPMVRVWPTASPITYGQTLSNSVISGGSANVPGVFRWKNSGLRPNAGVAPQTVVFYPTQPDTYGEISGDIQLEVRKGMPVLSWIPNPLPNLVHPNPISAAQLKATSTLPGAFQYNPPLGSVLPVGTHTLVATFSPADTTNHAGGITVTNRVVVTKGSQTITFLDPPVSYLDDGKVELRGTASSGLPVIFSSANTNIATVTGSTVTLRGEGVVEITALQAGSANWNEARPVQKSLIIRPSAFRGLIGYYPFEGNADDRSGYGRNLSIQGASLTSGRRGTNDGAYQLRSGDYLIGSKNVGIQGNTSRTFSCWVCLDPSTQTSQLMGFGSDSGAGGLFSLNYDGPGSPNAVTALRMTGNYRDTLFMGRSYFSEATWQHVVLTYENSIGNTTLYVNGVKVVPPTLVNGNLPTDILATTDGPLLLGKGLGSSLTGTLGFSGKIDDVRIYNRALSAQEVLALFRLEGGSRPPPESSYPGFTDVSDQYPSWAENPGMAADFDGDGWTDRIRSTETGLTLHRKTSAVGFAYQDNPPTAQLPGYRLHAVADFDKDGRTDLLVEKIQGGGLAWLRNDGNNQFFEISLSAVMNGELANRRDRLQIADPDGDGDLDILYAITRDNGKGAVVMLVNDFTPSRSSGRDLFPSIRSLVEVNWASAKFDLTDANLDGRVDILIIETNGNWPNDTHYDHPGHLYLNQGGGVFAELPNCGITAANEMSNLTSWDLDNDGDLDLINGSSDWRNVSTPHIYLNDGNGRYAQRVSPIFATQEYYHHGITLFDADLDQDLDAVWSCLHNFSNLYPRMWRNEGGGNFQDATSAWKIGVNIPNFGNLGMWGTAADLDGDGDEDLVFHLGNGWGSERYRKIYRNEAVESGRNWLKIRLVGAASPKDGRGARVEVRAGGKTLTQYLGHGLSDLDTTELIFGLGSSEQADWVKVYWPVAGAGISQGMVTELTKVKGRQTLIIQEISKQEGFSMYGLDGQNRQLVRVDLTNGLTTKVADLPFSSGWCGFDYNPADGFLYVALAEGNRNQAFYKIHPQTGAVQRVGTVSSPGGDGSFESIGFRNDGSLLAYDEHYDMYTGHLLSVDMARGTSQILGSSGTPSCLGGDYDPQRNTFWVSDEWNAKLYQLNPSNGSVVWTSASTWITGNGPGDMFDVDVAPDGNVYVAVTDRGTNKILKCDPLTGVWREQCTVSAALRLASVPGNSSEGTKTARQ